MRKLDGYNNGNGASVKNPVTKKQKAILEAIRYYFDDYNINPKNAHEAYKEIGRYKERIDIESDKIYIDNWLIKDKNGILATAPKFTDRIKKTVLEITECEYDNVDYDRCGHDRPKDMSDWDDDDWIDFELEH